MLQRQLGAVAFGFGVCAFLLVMNSAALAQSKCDAGEWKAAGLHTKCLARVHSKAVKKGIAPDANKLVRCDKLFLTRCARAQIKDDCIGTTTICETDPGSLGVLNRAWETDAGGLIE